MKKIIVTVLTLALFILSMTVVIITTSCDSHGDGNPCDQTAVVWDYFYEAYRNNKPYPITPEQAAEVVRVLELAKAGTVFEKKSRETGKDMPSQGGTL